MWIARHGIIQSNKYVTPPLDIFTGAVAAYSVARKLRTAYTGSAIKVRRSSDNTEQDIGYDSNGNLNESSLTSFVGSGNGFVTTLYDNSTLGYNATQTTQSRQPKIVDAGSIYKVNNKPSILFDGANTYLSMPTSVADAFEAANKAFTWGIVHKINNTTNSQGVVNISGNTSATLGNNDVVAINYLNTNLYQAQIRDFVTVQTDKLITLTANSTNFSVVVWEREQAGGGTAIGVLEMNNTSSSGTDQTLPVLSLNFATIGARIRGTTATSDLFLDGYISEIILITDTDINRTSFKTNFNSYYNIF